MVPVIKGNGYGYGLRRLAEESTLLGVDTIAVGTAAGGRRWSGTSFAGDVVILNPWDRGEPVAAELAERSAGDHHGVAAGRPRAAGAGAGSTGLGCSSRC